MIIPDSKKAAAAIVTSMGDKKDKPAGQEGGGHDSDVHAVADEMLFAIKEGSAKKLASALKSFMALDAVLDEEEEHPDTEYDELEQI